VQALDRILQRMERQKQQGVSRDEPVAACVLRALEELGDGCELPADGKRTYKIRVGLDPRYQSNWPDWEERFMGTVECVNLIYQPAGVRFELESVLPWLPGAERNDLRRLLTRLRREVAASASALRLGVVVWSKRRVQSQVGGEIGLAQGDACVVPAWPRVENDCITLAHELGHLVGARHVPGKDWIMAWKGHTYRLPVSDPLARVVRHHKLHPRNQLGIRAFHRARQTAHGLHPTEGCAELMYEVDRCWALTGLR